MTATSDIFISGHVRINGLTVHVIQMATAETFSQWLTTVLSQVPRYASVDVAITYLGPWSA